MNGIIYTRVSSDEQTKGTSLEFQEELCRKYCNDKGIAALEVFREEGASAKTADRKELLRALEYCRKHKTQIQASLCTWVTGSTSARCRPATSWWTRKRSMRW